MFNSRRKREQREQKEWEERCRCLMARRDGLVSTQTLALRYGPAELIERALPDMLIVSKEQALEMETHFKMEMV